MGRPTSASIAPSDTFSSVTGLTATTEEEEEEEAYSHHRQLTLPVRKFDSDSNNHSFSHSFSQSYSRQAINRSMHLVKLLGNYIVITKPINKTIN